MAESRAVHECLFCSQRFGSAADKDDHVLEHFAQEICIDCDQNLIRIGGRLYTLHDAVTCLKREVKSEEHTGSCDVDQPSQQSIEHIDGRINIKTERESSDLEHESDSMLDWIESTNFADIYESEQQQSVLFEEVQTGLKQEIVQNEHAPNVAGIDPVGNTDSQSNHSKQRSRKTFECKTCGKILSTKPSLRTHTILLHSAPGTIFCKICAKKFSTPEALDEHRPACASKKRDHMRKYMRKVAKSSGSVECEICGKMLALISIRSHKVLKHSSPDTIFCGTCCKVFSTQAELHEHKQKCLTKKQRDERRMLQGFPTQEQLDEQRQQCPSKKRVTEALQIKRNRDSEKIDHRFGPEDISGSKVISTQAESHEQKQKFPTKKQKDERSREMNDISGFQCYLCKMEFNMQVGFRHHMRSKHLPIDKVVCAVCGEVVHPDALQRHLNSVHKQEPAIPPGPNLYQCKPCKIVFKSSVTHRVHMQRKHDPNASVTKPNSFECEFCGKVLSNIAALRRHKTYLHSAPGTIFCKICGRLFATPKKLDEHAAICASKKRQYNARFKFICEICTKPFKYKMGLHKHMMLEHN